MLGSILVALDGTPSSLAAARAALMIATEQQAHVTALGLVNAAWLERAQPVPIGGAGLKAELDHALVEASEKRIAAVLERFSAQARAFDVRSDARAVSGDVMAILQQEVTAHDLIVVSRLSRFDGDGDNEKIAPFVDRMVREEPRPLLVVPGDGTAADLPPDSPVLVAFDGSPASSRALHMLALLGLAANAHVHVVTAGAGARDAEAKAAAACQMLTRHGCTDAHAIGLSGASAHRPADAILDTAKTIGARMIVIGAYGTSGIQRLFGSCTRRILDACPVPVLVHH